MRQNTDATPIFLSFLSVLVIFGIVICLITIHEKKTTTDLPPESIIRFIEELDYDSTPIGWGMGKYKNGQDFLWFSHDNSDGLMQFRFDPAIPKEYHLELESIKDPRGRNFEVGHPWREDILLGSWLGMTNEWFLNERRTSEQVLNIAVAILWATDLIEEVEVVEYY